MFEDSSYTNRNSQLSYSGLFLSLSISFSERLYSGFVSFASSIRGNSYHKPQARSQVCQFFFMDWVRDGLTPHALTTAIQEAFIGFSFESAPFFSHAFFIVRDLSSKQEEHAAMRTPPTPLGRVRDRRSRLSTFPSGFSLLLSFSPFYFPFYIPAWH